MSNVGPFHSVNESRKGAPRYHTNDACPRALEIPRDDWRVGSGGYYQCETCKEMRASAQAVPEPAKVAASAEVAQ